MLCPACSREISDSARFCRHCRADLSEMGATSLSPLPAVAETVSVYCPACGVRISSTLRFCKSCGHRLATSLAERGGTAVDPLPLSRPIASPADSSPRVADPAPVTAEDEPFKAAPVEETWADPALAFDASPERTGAAWIVLITLLVAALGAGGWWWSQRQGFSDRAPLAAPAATPIPAVATPAAAPQPATVENTATPVAPVAPPAAPTVEANPPAAQTVAKKAQKAQEVTAAKKMEEAKAAARQAEQERMVAQVRAQAAAQAASIPVPVPVARDWSAALRADLSACAREAFFQRVVCAEKARWKHCPGHWGTSADCPGSNNGEANTGG